jgi:hypothetical protein
MAVTLQMAPSKFAAIFGIDDDSFIKLKPSDLDKKGLLVCIDQDHFKIVDSQGEVIVPNVGLKKGVISLAQSGELKPIVKTLVRGSIQGAYRVAYDISHGLAPVPFESEGFHFEESGGFKDVEQDTSENPATQPSVTTDSDPSELGKELPKVKLIDAVALYQPVSSTSEHSTYYMIAATGALKFAARLKDEILSIRVEGAVDTYQQELIAAGFNPQHFSKGYTSVHFHNVDTLAAQRALGAVLFGTGLTFHTQMPDVKELGGE